MRLIHYSACLHRQFHVLPDLFDSRAALVNTYPNTSVHCYLHTFTVYLGKGLRIYLLTQIIKYYHKDQKVPLLETKICDRTLTMDNTSVTQNNRPKGPLVTYIIHYVLVKMVDIISSFHNTDAGWCTGTDVVCHTYLTLDHWIHIFVDFTRKLSIYIYLCI